MNGFPRVISSLTLAAFALSLGACASDPSTPQTATSERDTPTTGSHIGKRYNSTGPDASGVTTYGGGALQNSPTGNGIPGAAPH